MNSRDYWKKRSLDLEQLLHDRSLATVRRISGLYDTAQEEVLRQIGKTFSAYVRGGALNEKKAQELLSVKETETARAELLEQYQQATGQAKRDIWARLSAPAYANRIGRLQALCDRLYAQTRQLAAAEERLTRERLTDTLEQSYYRTTFDIQQYTGRGYPFELLDDNQIAAALSAEWIGENWSDRIWDNLLHAIGMDATEGAKYRAARLVKTECAYVANQGHLMGYEAAEIECYIFLATLDLRTSSVCRSLDMKRFPVAEAQAGTNLPPMHPNCRSTTMPDMTDEQLRKTPRAARDPVTGKSITVPGDMSYAEWYEKFVERKNKASQTEMFRRKIGSDGQQIIDKPTYQKLTRKFLRRGGVIVRGEEATQHLDMQGAHASYMWGGNIAFFRGEATISDVLEEMYHAEQDRTNMFGEYPINEIIVRREIDAQNYLLSVAEEYKIPIEETEVTKHNLEQYEKELEELLNARK